MFVCPSVCTEQLDFLWTDFHEILYLGIFPNPVEKIQDSLKSDENNGNFTWRTMYIFDHIWLQLSYNEKYFGWKLYRKHILCSISFFFRKSCHIWDNMEKYCKTVQATDDNITRLMCIARWVPKATNTHIEYAILIAFPLQKWLHEHASSYLVPTLPAIFSTTKLMPTLKSLSYLLSGYNRFFQR